MFPLPRPGARARLRTLTDVLVILAPVAGAPHPDQHEVIVPAGVDAGRRSPRAPRA